MNINSIKAITAVCLCASILAVNCPIHGQNIDEPNFGYVHNVVGSVPTSGVTLSNVQMSNLVSWVPMEGSLPGAEQQLNHEAYNMELKGEIRNG